MTSDLSKYTIGWIAALHIELAAATVMLDKEHPKLPYDERDPNQYTLGRIGGHNVVIACLPAGQTGTSAATAVATQMLNKFKSIRIGFLVGIGGGVPSPKADIRLGDVVVSLPDMGHGGVVQYDLGKAEAKGHFRRTGHLNTPPKLLLSVVKLARASTTRDSHVDALLQELAFLPLAIVQAVMFMRENSLHESRYLELFRYQKLQDQSTDLLAQEFHDRNRYFGHANAVTTTWHLSFKQLQFHNPLAARLLSFLACIAPLDVPDSIMLPGISDPLLRLLAIEMLIGYQFLIRHRDDSLYDVQSLVHTTARRWLVNAGTWTTCTESAIQMLTPLIPHGGYDDHINYQLRVGHALHLLSHYSTQHERTIELWSRVGDCQRDLGYYSSAELCHRVVLDWRQVHLANVAREFESTLGLDHPDTSTSRYNLAKIKMHLGDFDGAKYLLEQVLDSRTKVLGSRHPDTLTAETKLTRLLSSPDISSGACYAVSKTSLE
ncbi:unnamed protein product [Aureobasidium pullulans]|nr:unnamed protein product [Aureobasidium pullulans]